MTRDTDRRLRRDLETRMARAQRHRLLQGYPMAPLMRPLPDGEALEAPSPSTRPAIVGVLPHPFCNPKVRGCGFCTFPHEKLDNRLLRQVVAQVCREIAGAPLDGREVEAIYIGGGTANLTPAPELRQIVEALEAQLGAGPREITLEGVPKYFLIRDAARMRAVIESPWPARFSLGVQTFDEVRLREMGRDGYGGRAAVEAVVERAHRSGATTSADLLLNLPGQTRSAMLDDVRIADEAGLDQICVYHLVLFEGLGTEWSRDPAKLAALPDNAAALESWLAVRESLLARGFVQTTLTNFERASNPRRFRYELASFQPWRYDAFGFGPGAISTFDASTKRINRETAVDYLFAMERRYAMTPPVAREFTYEAHDRDLLYLTRGLARGHIDVGRLSRPEDFEQPLELCRAQGLIEREGGAIRLTPRGMFYADSVTGLLASRRARELAPTHSPRHLPVNDSRYHAMG